MSEPSTFENIKNSASNIGENISNGLNAMKESATSGLNNINDKINEKINDFSSNSTVIAASSYLDTNTIFAKFAFLILIVVAFIILFNLGMRLITYLYSTSSNPMLINGQIRANEPIEIPQDPKNPESIIIPRSNNQLTGIEFTWSVWLSYGVGTTNQNSHMLNIFTKGDFSKSGSNAKNNFPSLNNGPGVYFGPSSTQYSNSLWILMDTISESSMGQIGNIEENILTNKDPAVDVVQPEFIEITNIPINKYFHLAIRCQNKFIDVYINGSIVKHTNLINVPKQNYYKVTVGDQNFNNSWISNLQYFSKALSVLEINNIVQNGPNTSNAGKSGIPQYMPNYLSSLWYSNKIQ